MLGKDFCWCCMARLEPVGFKNQIRAVRAMAKAYELDWGPGKIELLLNSYCIPRPETAPALDLSCFQGPVAVAVAESSRADDVPLRLQYITLYCVICMLRVQYIALYRMILYVKGSVCYIILFCMLRV